MTALVRRYPRLQAAIPRTDLASLPTPVEKLAALGRELGTDNLFVKRDDLSAPVYGGNKVRKLEFLLAEARKAGAGRVLTTGGAGSNHAMATALYARQLGLKASLLLFPQPNGLAVQRNLLMDLYLGADLHFCPDFSLQAGAMEQLRQECRRRDGREPFMIPVGGSSATGALGYVNAALELAQQVEAGELPLPGDIYLAAGTLGTMVGLVLGLKLAGLGTRVKGVRVVPSSLASAQRASQLFAEVNQLLHTADPAIPLFDVDEACFSIDQTCFGAEYGLYTAEAIEAVRLMRRTAGLQLDGTYTGKAAVAFLAAARTKPRGEVALFWNTKSSRPLPAEALALDWRRLPEPFHAYFTGPSQQLDAQLSAASGATPAP